MIYFETIKISILKLLNYLFRNYQIIYFETIKLSISKLSNYLFWNY